MMETLLLIGFLAVFISIGVAIWFGAFYLMCWFMDWRCARCIEREPDNQFCCE